MLDRYIAERTWTMFTARMVIDLCDAIEALGGTLTTKQQRASEFADDLRDLHVERRSTGSAPMSSDVSFDEN